MGWHSSKLLKKTNRVQFFETQYRRVTGAQTDGQTVILRQHAKSALHIHVAR